MNNEEIQIQFPRPGEYSYYQPGNINPLFYGLEAIGTNAVESEATAAFEDINIPL